TWPDRCLGVVRMGVLCAQGVTPGFRIILEANGEQHEFHTDQTGTSLMEASANTPAPVPSGEPTSQATQIPVDIPPMQRKAIDAATGALGLPADQVQLVRIEPVQWPDACLGVTRMGVLCAQGVVDGFRIILAANGRQYEFHTNLDGTSIAPTNGPAVAPAD